MLSSAAALPISGFAPAPRPLVSFSPIWILFSALDCESAWRSVLMATNSTPRRAVLHHAVDGVIACATAADDLDARAGHNFLFKFQH